VCASEAYHLSLLAAGVCYWGAAFLCFKKSNEIRMCIWYSVCYCFLFGVALWLAVVGCFIGTYLYFLLQVGHLSLCLFYFGTNNSRIWFCILFSGDVIWSIGERFQFGGYDRWGFSCVSGVPIVLCFVLLSNAVLVFLIYSLCWQSRGHSFFNDGTPQRGRS